MGGGASHPQWRVPSRYQGVLLPVLGSPHGQRPPFAERRVPLRPIRGDAAAPVGMAPLTVEFPRLVTRAESASVATDGASTTSTVFNTSKTRNISERHVAKMFVSTSAQPHNGTSDNPCQHRRTDLEEEEEEWYPREFGPVISSSAAMVTPHTSGTRDSGGDFEAETDSDTVMFYFDFVRRYDGGTPALPDPAVTAEDLLKVYSTERACLEAGMGGASSAPHLPCSGRNRLSSRASDEARSRRRCPLDRRSPVDADAYVDAFHRHSRERQRRHFFIDNEGEICCLYRTEGWRQLRTPRRVMEAGPPCPSTAARHRGHTSHSGSSDALEAARCNFESEGTLPGSGEHITLVHKSDSGDRGRRLLGKVKGVVPHGRDKRSPKSESTGVDHRRLARSPTTAKSHQLLQYARDPTQLMAGSGVPSVTLTEDSDTGADPQVEALGHAPKSYGPIWSGRATALSGSHTTGDGDTVALAHAVPYLSSILIRQDSNLGGGGDVLRCDSRVSLTDGVGVWSKSVGEATAGESEASVHCCTLARTARRVSFSRDTLYFKKDPLFMIPRQRTDSVCEISRRGERTLMMSPKQKINTRLSRMGCHDWNRVPEKHVQLTLLKNKMSQFREARHDVGTWQGRGRAEGEAADIEAPAGTAHGGSCL